MTPKTPTKPGAGSTPPERRKPSRKKLRSGFVTLLGRPNAGKSTLVNALVGSKVAIVTPHPQTTRTHLLGVVNLAAAPGCAPAQIVLVDTPGVHRGHHLLHRELMRSVRAGLEGRDLCLVLIDASRRWGAEDAFVLELLRGDGAAKIPSLLVVNKIDLLPDKSALLPIIENCRRLADFDAVVPISARSGENLPLLLREVVKRLPAGPAFFEAHQITDQPEQFLITEVIREKAMLLTREEVPHSLAVHIEQDHSEAGVRHLAAALICERPGQKAILVGKRGAMIRDIGIAARQELEAGLKTRIYLELQVLVRESWRDNPMMLERNLGFRHER